MTPVIIVDVKIRASRLKPFACKKPSSTKFCWVIVVDFTTFNAFRVKAIKVRFMTLNWNNTNLWNGTTFDQWDNISVNPDVFKQNDCLVENLSYLYFSWWSLEQERRKSIVDYSNWRIRTSVETKNFFDKNCSRGIYDVVQINSLFRSMNPSDIDLKRWNSTGKITNNC